MDNNKRVSYGPQGKSSNTVDSGNQLANADVDGSAGGTGQVAEGTARPAVAVENVPAGSSAGLTSRQLILKDLICAELSRSGVSTFFRNTTPNVINEQEGSALNRLWRLADWIAERS